jgi:secreted PhoX family phosphatase
MFPGFVGTPTLEQVNVELMAHGVSIVEVRRHAGREWNYEVASSSNRRITGETEIEITGPAAGHEWMQTTYDPTGARVRGTLNNCAGGKTPWGTLLTCEENMNVYFANRGAMSSSDPRKAIHARYGLPSGATVRTWELYHSRFDVLQEPNEPFRFGWVVELDPYDPTFVPKKRTALGRFKHEGATVALARDRRVAVYSGDDERFDYIYKFVSAGRFDRTHREANLGLLDEGTLYVAKFHDDGTGEWLPLLFGEGPLVPANGFDSQARVLINTRGAADLLGATKMDRPEDIETNPRNGKVYCVMTKNEKRGTPGNPGVDAANPRPENRFGHIIELTEDEHDAAATTFTWEIFMLCGNPASPPPGGVYFAGYDPSLVSPIATPDNITFDRDGNMWIATDGQGDAATLASNDGVFAVPVEGEERGFVRQFLSVPSGAEATGPELTPNDTTLFCAVQHPGKGKSSYWPDSRWPDGDPATPRPSVVAVVKSDPGRPTIGS